MFKYASWLRVNLVSGRTFNGNLVLCQKTPKRLFIKRNLKIYVVNYHPSVLRIEYVNHKLNSLCEKLYTFNKFSVS